MVSLRARIDIMKQRGLRSLLSKPETISKPKETEAKIMVTIRIAIRSGYWSGNRTHFV